MSEFRILDNRPCHGFLAAILTGRQEIEGEVTKPHTFLCKSSSRLTTTRDCCDYLNLVELGILGC